MRQAEEIAQDIWALVKQDISGACPFFAFVYKAQKDGRRKAEPHIGKRGAQLISQTKIYLGKEITNAK